MVGQGTGAMSLVIADVPLLRAVSRPRAQP
jgi:hypothetical protein